MIYGSVCSGIEAATRAWHPLGWSPAFFSEIEKFPSQVLAHHYGSNMPGNPLTSNGVPNLGDMTQFQEWPDYAIDLLVGGTPCQTFSVAGLRAGLDDPRGNLMLVYAAVAQRYRPRWVVWENVVGVLSDDGGRGFASLLGLLSGRRVEVPHNGWRNTGIIPGYKGAYGLAWRVLDAEYVRVDGMEHAVPQRRRRVFVVGYLGDWRRAAGVLLEPESMQGNPPPRREAGKVAAGTLDASLGRRRGSGMNPNQITAIGGGPDGGQVSGAVVSKWSKGSGGPAGDEMYNMVAISADVAPPLTTQHHADNGDREGLFVAEVAPTLNAGGNETGGHRFPGTTVDTADSLVVANTLRAEGFDASEDGTGRQNLIPISFDWQAGDGGSDKSFRGGSRSYIVDKPGRVRSLSASKVPAVAFSENSRGEVRLEGGDGAIAPPLTTGGGKPGQGYSAISSGYAVRRLTPRECERLQGFPDDFTLIPVGKNMAADGPRYRALGNSMAVNVMRWIGTRIQMVDEIEKGSDW